MKAFLTERNVNSISDVYEERDAISLCISKLMEVALVMDDSLLERLNFDVAAQIEMHE